ncbi:MAG: nuclear transport factor 2 family protein, partial [Hyphococcus sp.]
MVGVVKNEDGSRTLQAFPDMESVIANWAANQDPEGTGRDGEILDMKVVDGQIAMVMFRYKDEYYDVLTLVKIDGAWKIATKTFVQR